MSGTRVIPAQRLDAILEESIHARLPVVLTYRTPEGWRMYKSVFASGSSESESIFVKTSMPSETAGAATPQPGETLGVTFRLGHKKCMFSSTLQSVRHQAEVALVALRWPAQLQQLQRRVYKRVVPPKGEVIAVRFWFEDVRAGNTPDKRTVRHGQLEDISVSGMRLKVADPKDMRIGRTYRAVFAPRPGAPSLVMDATLCHHEAADRERASLGFQFIGLETSPQGRRTLDRLAQTVSRFQRTHQRRRSQRSRRRP